MVGLLHDIFRVQPSGLLLLQVFRYDHYPDAIQFLLRPYVPLEIVPTLPEFCFFQSLLQADIHPLTIINAPSATPFRPVSALLHKITGQ